MNNVHRYFIQYLLRNGSADAEKAFEYCRRVSKGSVSSPDDFKTIINEIRREICKQYYNIVIARCEVTGRQMIVWINTKNDRISVKQSNFTETELEYFQAILQEIMQSPLRKVSFIACLNITSSLTGTLNIDAGQNTLNKWLKRRYFVKQDDFIYLGITTILEFTSYLKSACPHNSCGLCSELVFTGKICAACDKIFHSFCLNKYFTNKAVCPNCKHVWYEAETFQDSQMSQAREEITDNPNETENTLSHRESQWQESSHITAETESETDMSQPGPSYRGSHIQGSQIIAEETDDDVDPSQPGPSHRTSRRQMSQRKKRRVNGAGPSHVNDPSDSD